MARFPFIVFKRTEKSGKVYYSIRYQDNDGNTIRTIALREAKNRTHAVRIAEQKLKDGIISNDSNPNAIEYLYSFWKRDSDYVKGRALRGIVLSDKNISESRRLIEKRAADYLHGNKLLDLTPQIIEKMILSLSKQGIGARQINCILQAIKVPFAHFTRMHHLANPLTSIQKVKENPKERGILSTDEIGKLINLHYDNPRVKAAILLAALCGLRLGEIRGLQLDDINGNDGIITIRNNIIDKAEGLKRPKWSSSRIVPTPAPVIESLKLCAQIAPANAGTFALWNQKTITDPIPSATIQHGFKNALKEIGISREQQKERNIVFHGLRHTFVSLSRSAGIPDFIVQRLAGHKSMEMTNSYSHADGIIDYQEARAAMEKALDKKAKKAVDKVDFSENA